MVKGHTPVGGGRGGFLPRQGNLRKIYDGGRLSARQAELITPTMEDMAAVSVI